MTKQQTNLRVALIGYGLAGSVFHAPTIKCTPGLTLDTIVTSNATRADQAARDFPTAKIVSDVNDVFSAADKHDLVVVAAPNKFHYKLARSSLEAGMAAVVDKPAATNSEDV